MSSEATPSRDRRRAHEYLRLFARVAREQDSYSDDDGVSNKHNLDCLADDIMGVPLPPDVYQFFCRPPTSLREIAFDALAGLEHACPDQLPETLRAEYWRRRWMQLARQSRCADEQFADAMMQLLFD